MYYTVAGWFSSSDTRPLMDSAFIAEATPVQMCRIKLGADPNTRGTVEMYFGESKDTVESASLLMLAAAWNKRPSVVELLLSSGADIHEKDKNGGTPLMFAASNNSNPEVVALLLKAGADINEKDKVYGKTPLMYAASNNSNPEVVELLLQAGADINEKDKNGSNAAYGCCASQL